MNKETVVSGCTDKEETGKEETENNMEEFINAVRECEENKGEPCTCNALVCCTSSENEDEAVHMKKDVEGRDVLMADVAQLNRNDIEREEPYIGCRLSKDKKCTIKKEYIEGQTWQGYEENNSQGEGKELLNINKSYMMCTYGMGYIFFKDAGQIFKNQIEELAGEELLVTLEQLKNIPGGWEIRTILSYDLEKSIPIYAEGVREITQEDVDEINRVLWKYEINAPNRIVHFLSQCYVETGGGYSCVERYNTVPLIDFLDYEKPGNTLGNTTPGDGALFRGAGAIQITGRAVYEEFALAIGDSKIATDGALYVGQNYYWEAAGYFWTIYKPSSASGDIFNLNKKCDDNESVDVITKIVNGGYEHLNERKEAYSYFSGVIQ